MLRPVIVVINACASVVLRLFGVRIMDEVSSTYTREEVAALVEESRGEGLIEPEEYDRLSGALGFTEKPVPTVLMPPESLTTVAARLHGRRRRGAAAPPPASAGSRSSTTSGDLLGYLHIKDVLETDEALRQRVVEDKWIRPFAPVAADDLLHDALETLQRRGAHMAVVVDGDGRDARAGHPRGRHRGAGRRDPRRGAPRGAGVTRVVTSHHYPLVVTEPASEDARASTRVWTLPNVLSVLRLLGVPLFLYLVLGPGGRRLGAGAADGLRASPTTSTATWPASSTSRPSSARSSTRSPTGSTSWPWSSGLAMRDVIPWWLAISLPLRDLLMWGLVPLLRTRGYSALPVHFLGKAATFNLLYAFPLLLLGDGEGTVARLAEVFGWAFAFWGVGLYWWAGVLYAYQVHRLLATTERRPDGRCGPTRWLSRRELPTGRARRSSSWSPGSRSTSTTRRSPSAAPTRPGRPGRPRTAAPRSPSRSSACSSRSPPVQNSRNADVDEASRAALIERIDLRKDARRVARRTGSTAQRDQNERLVDQVVGLATAGARTPRSAATRSALETGFVAVSGPGVRVTVDDQPQGDPDGRVRATDLRLLVNGLWQAGAEAIAINGRRLTALSAIVNSDIAIQVNKGPLSPPYVVQAIGGPNLAGRPASRPAVGTDLLRPRRAVRFRRRA